MVDHCSICLNLFCDKMYCVECDRFIPRKTNTQVNENYCICEYHENRE